MDGSQVRHGLELLAVDMYVKLVSVANVQGCGQHLGARYSDCKTGGWFKNCLWTWDGTCGLWPVVKGGLGWRLVREPHASGHGAALRADTRGSQMPSVVSVAAGDVQGTPVSSDQLDWG